jgi:hypothetical protein
MLNDLYQVPSHYTPEGMDHGDFMHEVASGSITEIMPELADQIKTTGYILKMSEDDRRAMSDVIVKFVNLRTREFVYLTREEAMNLTLVSNA